MKRYIITILIILIALSAFASIIKAPSSPLEWWLRSQGKFDGASVCTKQNPDGTFSITKWIVNGVKQPTDSEVDQIIANYELQPKPKTLEERVTTLESKTAVLEAK